MMDKRKEITPPYDPLPEQEGKTNEDYIREAVELADGWELYIGIYGDECAHDASRVMMGKLERQVVIDALAMQLARQVDALADMDNGPVLDSEFSGCCLIVAGSDDWHAGDCKAGPAKNDRAMNIIRAVVDSGVLKPAAFMGQGEYT